MDVPTAVIVAKNEEIDHEEEYNDSTEFESDDQDQEHTRMTYRRFIQLGEEEDDYVLGSIIRTIFRSRSEPDLRKVGFRFHRRAIRCESITGGGRGDADSAEDFDFPSTKSDLGSHSSDSSEILEDPCGVCTYCIKNSFDCDSASSSTSINSFYSEEYHLHRREDIYKDNMECLMRSESEPENLDRYREAIRMGQGSSSSCSTFDEDMESYGTYELLHSVSAGILEGSLRWDREVGDKIPHHSHYAPFRRCYSMGQLRYSFI